MKKGWKKGTLTIPIIYIENGEYTVIATSPESEDIFEQPHVSQGKTFKEAEKSFWTLVKCMNNFNRIRSCELDRWKPFTKGDWKQIGGYWFKVFGIHFSFRYGKGMQGGRYIPFTKLNINISNSWRHKIDKTYQTTPNQ